MMGSLSRCECAAGPLLAVTPSQGSSGVPTCGRCGRIARLRSPPTLASLPDVRGHPPHHASHKLHLRALGIMTRDPLARLDNGLPLLSKVLSR